MINDSLTISKKCLELLRGIEALSIYPYDDRNKKLLTKWNPSATIGYGHLIRRDEWTALSGGVSVAMAEDIFKNDLVPAERAIKKYVIVSLSQQQYDALVVLVFNIGIGAFEKSSALKLINDSRAVTAYSTLEAAWKAFNKQGKKVSAGLVNRRVAEWKIWKFGIYERW